MYSKVLEYRYIPGKRGNSFYVDLPRLVDYEERMEVLKETLGYTYYIDGTGQRLVRKKYRITKK